MVIKKILPIDWQRVYNHPIYLLETFVDTEKFKGIEPTNNLVERDIRPAVH